MNSIDDRLNELESALDDQQAQIEAHEETIAAQQATIEAQRERLAAVENGGGVSMPISRRGALTAGGALGLLGLGAGTASAQGSGQIGTSDTPVDSIYAEKINGGLTGNNEIGQLFGWGLEVYETEDPSAIRVDWEYANDLDDSGGVTPNARSKWMQDGPTLTPQVDTQEINISNILSNIVEASTIRSVDNGDSSLSINFGGDSMIFEEIEENDEELGNQEQLIEISIDGETYYMPLYDENNGS